MKLHSIESQKQPTTPESQTGDTPLHDYVRNCSNLNELTLMLKSNLGKQYAAAMAKHVNNEGNIPLSLKPKHLNPDQKKELLQTLLELSKPTHFKKLSDPLDFSKIIKRYPDAKGTPLYDNLELACLAANATREVLKVSETHPQTNNLPNKNDISKRNQITRIIVDFQIKLSCLSDKEEKLDRTAQLIKMQRQGNCAEFAVVARHAAREKNPSIETQLLWISNGDHVFLMIGSEPHAVVCDAWSGKVYPAYEIAKKMKSYLMLEDENNFFNIITSYNRDYHKIKSFNYSTNSFPWCRLFAVTICLGAMGMACYSQMQP